MSLDFIAEMAWKSAAISGVALLALVLLRSRSAADRVAVVRLAVIMLLLLPAVSLGLPALQVERPVPVVEALPAIPLAPTPIIESERHATLAALPAIAPSPEPSPASFELPTGVLMTLAYLAGVLLLSVHLLAGLWTLRRWTAAAEPVRSPAWNGALRRAAAAAGLAVPVRLLASGDVPSPLSWGLRRPTILVDLDTLAQPEHADGVLAHEIAHVVRRDWAMLMLSRLAVALFWFNPLVWLLERALVEQAEEAADRAAVGDVEPVSYAQTLVACGAQAGGRLLPANSIAAGQGLARRVRAVLDEQRRLTPSGSSWTGAAMLLCILVSAPIAALELVAPEPPAPPAAAVPPSAPAAPRAPAAPQAPLAPAELDVDIDVDDIDIDEDIDVAGLEAEIGRAVEAEMTPARIAAMESAGMAATRSAEITQVAVQAAARAGAAASAAARAAIDVDDLIAMRVHGIDSAYLTQLASVAPRLRLSADELVEAKVHGLTPTRLREFADLGYAAQDIDDLVAMQIHGVSPSFIREMAGAGYRGLSPDDLVALRIHGVTPERARRAAARGKRPSAEELVEMSIHGEL